MEVPQKTKNYHMIQQSLSGPIARKNYNSKRYMQTYVWASQAAQWYRIHMQCRKFRFDPWVRKIPWRRKRQPTPVFLPGESNGRRSLMGYSPWDCTELDVTQQLNKYHHHLCS